MNIVHLRHLPQLNKSGSSGISMRKRLFLFYLVLVLTMAAGIFLILLVMGVFSTGVTESRRILKNELKHRSQEISTEYGQLSVQSAEFSRETSQKIEDYLIKNNLLFSSLSDNPTQLEELLSELYNTTYYSLQKADCSGAFIILDTTVNPALEGSEYSKAGLYLKNMEPNVISAAEPNFTLLRGFPSISRDYSINLHTQWGLEFNVKNATYYNTPIRTAKKHSHLPLSKLNYWSDPLTFPDTNEDVMLCSVPLIDSNNNIYGVCGFEISAMLFKLSHMPDNNTYARMFCMLSPYSNSRIAVNRSMVAGGYSVKDFLRSFDSLTVHEKASYFNTYEGNGSDYLGFQTVTQLYPKDSPYADEVWVTAVLVPKDDITNSSMLLNIILACLLSLLVIFGILISIYFSHKYLSPISKGIEAIKSAETDELTRTNVQEIDDLIEYLADYRKQISQKADEDKYQISLLEQFVEKSKALTPAERSVFNLYAKGLSAREIADSMFLSINTIKTHSKHIFAKLEVASREELLLYINMLKEIGLEIK